MTGASSSSGVVGGSSFSWKGKGVLSKVRTAKHNTCVYRAFCDVADARVRIMALQKKTPRFKTRFSARKLFAREKDWTRPGNRKKFLDHYTNGGLPLPMAVSSKNPAFKKYKLAGCISLNPKKEESAIALVKSAVEEDGPVIGGFHLCKDYLDEGIYFALGDPVVPEKTDFRRPRAVDDPVPLTDLSSGDEAPERPAELAAAAAAALAAAAAAAAAALGTSGASVHPSAKKYTSHAVCIVGYGNEEGIDYFEVQENQGRLAWKEGYRKVAVTAMTQFYVPLIQEL